MTVALKYFITVIIIVALIIAWRVSSNNARLSTWLEYISLFLIIINYLSDEILIRCPCCNKRITFIEYHRGKCRNCGYRINYSEKNVN